MAIWRVESQTSKITPNFQTMFWGPQINSNWTTWYIIGKSQNFLIKLSILIWNEKNHVFKIVRLIISHFWKFPFWVFSKVCHSNETPMGSYKLYYREGADAKILWIQVSSWLICVPFLFSPQKTLYVFLINLYNTNKS